MEYCSEFVCCPPKRCTSGFLIDCQAENNHCVYSEPCSICGRKESCKKMETIKMMLLYGFYFVCSVGECFYG